MWGHKIVCYNGVHLFCMLSLNTCTSSEYLEGFVGQLVYTIGIRTSRREYFEIEISGL